MQNANYMWDNIRLSGVVVSSASLQQKSLCQGVDVSFLTKDIAIIDAGVHAQVQFQYQGNKLSDTSGDTY